MKTFITLTVAAVALVLFCIQKDAALTKPGTAHRTTTSIEEEALNQPAAISARNGTPGIASY